MGTKTLSISDDAYRRLRDLKQGDESFSQVIQRLTGRQDLLRYGGCVPSEMADDLATASTALRSQLDQEWTQRGA